MTTEPLDLGKGTSNLDWHHVPTAFGSADWSLADGDRSSARELHPYPARFIPELPGQILDILRPAGPVLDPFCGSGTTLFEARRRGLRALGNDLNPIASLISRVRTGEWERGDAVRAARHAEGLRAAVLSDASPSSRLDRIPRVDHWFEPWAQAALARAVGYLDAIEPTDRWHDRISLAISSVVVRLSRQESDTRYAAVDKRGNLGFAADELSRSVLRLADWLQHNAVSGAPASDVWTGDARSLPAIPDSSVEASIFSPPYPNAYEYWLYHKYRMYWLDHDPIAVRANELGARPHYCRKNGLTEVDFAHQMRDVFSELARVLVANAPVVVVIGDSVIGGRWIDNASLLETAAEPLGFSLFQHCQRPILRSRSSFNGAHSRGRTSEHVLLFRSPA